MGNVIEFKKNDEQITEVVEVATSQLTEHSKQAEYSPPMSKKKWTEFTANVAANGLHHPIIATKGFKVFGNMYHYRAAKELGLENVKVIFEDIADSGVPSYMTNNTLQVRELKRGQKAALVIRLFYEEERQKAKERMSLGGKGGLKEGLPDLADLPVSRDVSEELAKKAGIGRSSMTYLIAVYRNRPDLFELVFDGSYSIHKAYTQMKADEEPKEESKEPTPADALKRDIERMIEDDSTQPQYDESEHELSPRNRAGRLRKETIAMSAKVLNEVDSIKSTKDDVKDSARSQLLSLATSCIITLGQTAEKQNEQDLLYMALEVIKKIEEEIVND